MRKNELLTQGFLAALFFLLLLFLATLGIMIFESTAGANEIAPYNEKPYIEVNKAIKWLTRLVPKHPVQKNKKWRSELSAYIVEASYEYDLEPLLVTAVVFLESSFRKKAIGSDRPSIGLMQVHGVALNGCKDLDTAEGQLLCGSKWLRFCIDECEGSIAGGLALYGNGNTCWPPYKSLSAWQSWQRLRLWGRLIKIQTNSYEP